MEVSWSSISVAIVVIFVTWALNLVWLRPKRLERCLRRQGLRGNSYKFLYGDMKESSSMKKDANSRPIGLSDDIVPRILPFENHIIQKYGKDSYEWFGPSPRVMITEPEQIKEILVNRYGHFEKLRLSKLGLATLEGEEWAKHRKIINPAFQTEKLKLMLPAFYLSCSEMINKWEKMAADEGSCELDVLPDIESLTGDVISRTAFGSSYEEGRLIFKLIQDEVAEVYTDIIKIPYIPELRFIPTRMKKEIKEINEKIQSLLKDIISKKEKAMKMGEANSDLLGIMLESNMNEIRGNKNKKSTGLSTSDVINECKLFYFAGQDTSACLLVWTMVLLSQHPTWQDRARAEVLQVFGDDKPDYEGLNRLKIVTMILNEVLRLYPPAPLLSRAVRKETKLGKFTLPAGTLVTLPVIHVQRDKNIWGEDAKEFNPERFAGGISKATNGALSFFSFGWGPRVCIGQNYAMIEAKLAIATILRSFWFELSPSYVHAPFTLINLLPQHGCHLILHKR